MFIVQLKFAPNKSKAPHFMEGHNIWLNKGFDDGVFLLAGGLQPNLGGGILAHNTTLEELESRLKDDPFVQENIVSPEIAEITPSRTDKRLDFLKD